ncbi:Ribonuclease H-like superfamily [Sesbania bispinosa]|nr:Ribonuclease H-like superfamily [Sesbania bispinosa]
MAICKGLEVAINHGHIHICCESDSLSAIAAIQQLSQVNVQFYGSVLSRIKLLRDQLVVVVFQQVSHQLNSLADYLARMAHRHGSKMKQ